MAPRWRSGNWTTHLILLTGVVVFAFPVYLAVVGSTSDLGTVSRGELGLTPGPYLVRNYVQTWSTGSGERIQGTPVRRMMTNSLIMVRAARDYFERTGWMVGFKPAGGIRTAKQALDWLALMKEELGDAWLRPSLFRIGASGLLTDIERQLWHTATGHYAAARHQPMP